MFWRSDVGVANAPFNGVDGLISLRDETAAVEQRERNSGWAMLRVGYRRLLVDCRWINQAGGFFFAGDGGGGVSVFRIYILAGSSDRGHTCLHHNNMFTGSNIIRLKLPMLSQIQISFEIPALPFPRPSTIREVLYTDPIT